MLNIIYWPFYPIETYLNQVRLELRQMQLSSNHIALLKYRTDNTTSRQIC